MTDKPQPRVRYGEAFWRAHHEAWSRSELNQRADSDDCGHRFRLKPDSVPIDGGQRSGDRGQLFPSTVFMGSRRRVCVKP